MKAPQWIKPEKRRPRFTRRASSERYRRVLRRSACMNSSIRSVAGFAARVTEEDRKVLLGHRTAASPAHYSVAELGKLIDGANKISATDSRGPALTILRRKVG
jgi:hypothetical protein